MSDSRPEFDVVLRDTQSQIRGYIAGMGIPPHEVDDVAQDVYIELFRGFDRVPSTVPIERWLKGIARNLCLNHMRRKARRSRLHREALVEIMASLGTEIEMRADHHSIASALDGCCEKLSPKSQELVLLRYKEDLSSSAIAEAMNSTAEAVRVALFRIRGQLRDCITTTLAGQS